MKKLTLVIGLGIVLALAPRAKAEVPGDQTDELMKKMGFSAKEIAASQQTRAATTKALDAAGAKSGGNATSLSQAQGILDLRSVRQIRAQAIEATRAAEKEAQDAAAGAKEAEQKARNARNWVAGAVGNDGINSMVFSQALAGREKFEQAADAAREEAAAKAREAADIAEQSQRIIARANAQEAIIKSRGIDE